MKRLYFFLICVLLLQVMQAQSDVDVLIMGGGAGGTSAAIQAARMGSQVQIIESTPWLGGMLTAAGVSAIDGNHEMPSGIWGEFRQKLRDHYGGAEALATGWVSHTLFEPSVGNMILQDMATIPNLRIAYNAVYKDVQKTGDYWIVSFMQDGELKSIRATILIDATETGELIPLVGADYRLGMDAQDDTGETEAPTLKNSIVQDITYVAILQDVSESGLLENDLKGLVDQPQNYKVEAYECACKREGGEMFGAVADCQQMLNYGKLPNNKYMINWPNCGNDFYLNWPELTLDQRRVKIQEAKLFTQGFVYYIQQELGFRNLRLTEEFPTEDNFPMIPYDREARRVQGKVFLTVDPIERPYDFNLYKTGIAVGDYPIDHHHDKHPETPEIDFINIRVPSYNVPLGSLIPAKVENFIVAEKNISVSNIVNGATRLQPVVLGIGQAAGAIAATAIKENRKPSEISIREVQQSLLDSRAFLMPYIDVKTTDQDFQAIQKIGAAGILKGVGVPYKWANQTWFYPDQIVSEYEWKQGMIPYYPALDRVHASGKGITLQFLNEAISVITKSEPNSNIAKSWLAIYSSPDDDKNTDLNRREVSLITDKVLNPFGFNIDWDGNLK